MASEGLWGAAANRRSARDAAASNESESQSAWRDHPSPCASDAVAARLRSGLLAQCVTQPPALPSRWPTAG
eukprot:4021626-Prymnesium_polylepis.1